MLQSSYFPCRGRVYSQNFLNFPHGILFLYIMTNLCPKKHLGFLFLLLSFSLYAQGPGCPNVNAGPDVEVTCADPCTTLTASYLQTGETTSYAVTSIPYDPPFPFTGGTGSTNITSDDVWSEAIQLPFDFCFFGDPYSRLLISSNGSITFSIAGEVPNGRYTPSNGAGYVLGQDGDRNIPGNIGTTTDARAVLGIMGVLQDTYPPNSFSGWSINYEVIGTFPCRMLVFNMYNLGHYSCGTSGGVPQTYQIILYETTNAIDVFVKDRTPCNGFQEGRGAIGIQNWNGTVGYTPPGRNTGNWSASEEAWRFTPNGESNVEFTWRDAAGNIIGTDPSITVCVDETTTFTAQAEYTDCNGITITDIDTVTVTRESDIEVDLGEDVETCEDDPIVLDTETGDVPDLTYEWFLDGVIIPGATNSTYTATAPNSGEYTVEVNQDGCIITDSINILFNPQPIIANPPQDLGLCDDGGSAALFDLTQNDAVVLGTQDTDFVITYHHSQAEAENGTPFINPADAYPIVGNNETIWVRIQNANNTCFVVDSFEILLVSAFATAPPSPYYICDQDNTGSEPVNLQAIFSADILAGQDPNELHVTYHESAADADTGDNPLPQPYMVTTTQITLHARVENRLDEDCYSVTNFEIVMELPPNVNPTPLDLITCDTDNDGYAPFNLHDADDDITNGDPDLVVTYHPTELDAQNDLNELTDPYINDDPFNDVVFARIEGMNTSCNAVIRLNLEVRNSPILTEPSPLRLCDDNTDGLQIFDLTVRELEMLGAMDPTQYDFY
ncbi:hypothetical protein SAMN05216556_105165, partial [Aequorivita viscosa]